MTWKKNPSPSAGDRGAEKPEKKQFLSEFEEMVLLAVACLGEKAYGVPVWEALERASGREVAMGSIYVTLERLEKKGFVTSRLGEATAERGGRAKRYFRIEGVGVAALDEMERIRTALRDGRPQPAAAGVRVGPALLKPAGV